MSNPPAGSTGKTPIRPRQWLALLSLSLSAFVFTTSEFMPVGLLSSIARSFSISNTRAGIMISAYAWCVTLLSLPLMVLASRFDFKRLLLALMACFAAGQALGALAPTFPSLVLSRLLVACAHAVYWSIVAVAATRVVPPEYASQAVGMVTGGTSVANIVGMPLGRALGLALGWRMTFAAMGAAALAALTLLALTLPAMDTGKRFRVRRVPSLLRNQRLAALYLTTTLMSLAYYAGYGFIEPFLSDVAHLDGMGVTVALMTFGIAALVGVVTFSHAYDAHKVSFLRISLATQAAVLFLMWPFARIAQGRAMIGDIALWGVAEACYGTAFQALLIGLCPPDDAAVAMSVYSGLFNLGIGCGTALGGVVADGPGLALTGVVGGVIACLGLASFEVLLAPHVRALAEKGAGSAG